MLHTVDGTADATARCSVSAVVRLVVDGSSGCAREARPASVGGDRKPIVPGGPRDEPADLTAQPPGGIPRPPSRDQWARCSHVPSASDELTSTYYASATRQHPFWTFFPGLTDPHHPPVHSWTRSARCYRSCSTAVMIPSGSSPWWPICCHRPPRPSLLVPT